MSSKNDNLIHADNNTYMTELVTYMTKGHASFTYSYFKLMLLSMILILSFLSSLGPPEEDRGRGQHQSGQ